MNVNIWWALTTLLIAATRAQVISDLDVEQADRRSASASAQNGNGTFFQPFINGINTFFNPSQFRNPLGTFRPTQPPRQQQQSFQQRPQQPFQPQQQQPQQQPFNFQQDFRQQQAGFQQQSTFQQQQ